MTPIDPAQERQRLLEHYASLPEEALLQLAADRASLTDVASEALRLEMTRRKLSEPTSEPAPALEVASAIHAEPDDGLVVVRQFRDMPAALLAKGALESAGIECVLLNSNMVRLHWFISNLVGGARLQVRAEDAQVATEILDQAIPEGFEVEGIGDYEQPRCPKCGSVDITFEAINKPLSYGSAYLGVPIPFPRNVWKCESCGQQWQEIDETPEEQEP